MFTDYMEQSVNHLCIIRIIQMKCLVLKLEKLAIVSFLSSMLSSSRSLKEATSLEFTNTILQSNTRLVINSMSDMNMGPTAIIIMVEDIRNLSYSFQGVQFSYSNKNAKKITDALINMLIRCLYDYR